MKQSYNRLNKKGRFLFWWFIISQLITITTLSVLMIFNYNFIALKNQISTQEATIKNYKRQTIITPLLSCVSFHS